MIRVVHPRSSVSLALMTSPPETSRSGMCSSQEARASTPFSPADLGWKTDVALEGLEVRTRIDGAVVQEGHVSQMVFPIAELLRFIANIMTLEPGDLVLTGTPEGVGPLHSGQAVEVEVSGVGSLRHSVGAQSPANR